MRKLLVAALSVAFIPSAVSICGAENGPRLWVGAATSFVFDTNDPDRNGRSSFNRQSYANRKEERSFNVDLLQIGVEGSRGSASYRAKLDFGDLAKGLDDSLDDTFALQEAWIAYDMDAAGFAAGRFGTPIGYEAREPWANANVSRSWGWAVQPSNHDGLKAYTHLDDVDVMVGVVNSFSGTNGSPVGAPGNDLDDEKAVLASLGWAPRDEMQLLVAGIYTELLDTENTAMVTAIASGVLDATSLALSYALEAQWRRDDDSLAGAVAGQAGKDVSIWGFAGYVGTDLGATRLDLRLEWIDDGGILTDGFNGSFANDVELWEVTVTTSWELVAGLDLRLEYRHDEADQRVFANDGGGADKRNDVVQAQLVWYPQR